MTGEDFYNYYRGLVYESGPWAHLQPSEKVVWRKLAERTECSNEAAEFAYDDGYQEGYELGYDHGYNRGYKEGVESARQASKGTLEDAES